MQNSPSKNEKSLRNFRRHHRRDVRKESRGIVSKSSWIRRKNWRIAHCNNERIRQRKDWTNAIPEKSNLCRSMLFDSILVIVDFFAILECLFCVFFFSWKSLNKKGRRIPRNHYRRESLPFSWKLSWKLSKISKFLLSPGFSIHYDLQLQAKMMKKKGVLLGLICTDQDWAKWEK